MNKKLLVPLVLITLAVAPAAMAEHCFWCVSGQCIDVAGGGRPVCTEFPGGYCQTSGSPCLHFAPMEPLASEFTVVSVERLDEPQSAASAPNGVSRELASASRASSARPPVAPRS